MHWFPFYPSNFLGATVGLSCLERSLYALMLPLYYEVGPFPPDIVRVYRIVGCESDEQKRAVDYLLSNFFVLREDGWYQPKAEGIKAECAKAYNQAVERGKLSAEARRAKYGTAQPDNRKRFESLSKASGNASELTTTITTKTLTTPMLRMGSETGVSPDGIAQESTNLKLKGPACPYDAIVARYHEQLPASPRAMVRNPKREQMLRSRWREAHAAGQFATQQEGIEFFGEFFALVARSKFLTGKTPPGHGRTKAFVADLEWLITPTNFAKVIEGRYE